MNSKLQNACLALEKVHGVAGLAPRILAWVRDGDLNDLAGVSTNLNYTYPGDEVEAAVARDTSPEAARFLAAMLQICASGVINRWIERSGNDPDRTASMFDTLRAWPIAGLVWGQLFRHGEFENSVLRDGKPTAIGAWLIRQGQGLWQWFPPRATYARLLLVAGRDPSEQWLASALATSPTDEVVYAVATAIREGGAQFVPLGTSIDLSKLRLHERYQLLSALATVDRSRLPEAIDVAWRMVIKPSSSELQSQYQQFPWNRHGAERLIKWLAEHDSACVERMDAWLAQLDFGRESGADLRLDWWIAGFLKVVLTSGQGERLVLARWVAAHAPYFSSMTAVALLRESPIADDHELARHALCRSLASCVAAMEEPLQYPGASTIVPPWSSTDATAIRNAIVDRICMTLQAFAAGEVAASPDLFISLLSHPNAKIRTGAMVPLLKLGPPLRSTLQGLLETGNKEARVMAARLLGRLGVGDLAPHLESRLAIENADEVRTELVAALDVEWRANGRVFNDSEVQARVDRAGSRPGSGWCKWINREALPECPGKDGRPIPRDWIDFLLWRQHQHGEITVDPEARPIWERIDRTRAGDFGVAVLSQFLASKQDAKDKWALGVGCRLGDIRCAELLRPAVDAWAAKSRGALAEYAAAAMAMVDSQAALAMVDDVAAAYSVKNRNIGAAAREAFEAAALARGMTPDELGDAVVPWLAFKPGVPLTVDVKGEAVGVRVGTEGKLVFRVGGKDKTSLPIGASAPVKEQMKALAADLRGLMRAQVRRHSRMLVQQRRWPAAAWAKLYLSHPLLVPFLTQLIWAEYDSSGGIAKLFRGLPDGTLTDVEDGKAPTPTTNHVGLVHPLELDEATLAAWRTHLSDYEVVPPVPQLDRGSVRVPADLKNHRTYSAAMGTSLNALTFKGRAERLGWRRGAVVDGGCVNVYLKQFHAAGVDVVLGIDGMFMGVGVDDSISLREAWFVKGGSVNTGGYTYDEPSNGDDPRVLAFGDVPPIVYSETMAELAAIAGKAVDEDD